MRILIYEAICAGELGADPPASLLREGRAMRDALVADFRALPDIEVVTESARPFIEQVQACDAALVIAPELGRLLERRCAEVLAENRRWLGCTRDAIRLTSDKLALANHWTRFGLPTPTTQLAWDDPGKIHGPAVLKPRHGAGSQATRRIAHATEAAALLVDLQRDVDDDFLVQPYVSGRAASVSFLCSDAGYEPLLAGEQLLATDGNFGYLGGRMPLAEPWNARALALAQRGVDVIPGLHGFVGVDLILGEAEDVLIEVNPRLTTSYLGLRKLCVHNLAQRWLTPGPPLAWKPNILTFSPAE